MEALKTYITRLLIRSQQAGSYLSSIATREYNFTILPQVIYDICLLRMTLSVSLEQLVPHPGPRNEIQDCLIGPRRSLMPQLRGKGPHHPQRRSSTLKDRDYPAAH